MMSSAILRTPVVVVSLVLAGCSSGGGTALTPTAQAPSAPASSAPAPTPSPSAAAGQQPVPAEQNPPGDIPDNLAFVLYTNPAGRYTFTHPEGWAETTRGSTVVFTDKLNGVQIEVGRGTIRPSLQSAQQQDVPALQQSQPAFEARSVEPAAVVGGRGVRVVYRRNSAPDAVTGRQYRDEVERYELFANGRVVVVELSGPVGADNVDAYRTMINSLRLS